MGQSLGAFSVTYHAAFYMGKSSKEVSERVHKSMEEICTVLDEEKLDIWVRPETTGKPTQWGNLEEIVELSKNFKQVLPCVDFLIFTHVQTAFTTRTTSFAQYLIPLAQSLAIMLSIIFTHILQA